MEVPGRVLGTATANQVLLQWKDFVDGNSQLLRKQAPHPGEGLAGLGLKPAGVLEADGRGEVQVLDSELKASSAGLLVAALATAMGEARAVTAAAWQTVRPLALFGKRHRLDRSQSRSRSFTSSEGEAQQQPHPLLLLELAELLPTLRHLQEQLRRVSQVAEHLVRQLLGLHAAATARGGRLTGLAWERSGLSPLLEALGELLSVPATVDSLFSSNPHAGPAHATFSWIVSKAAATAAATAEGGQQQLGLPAEAALQLSQQLQELGPLLTGGAMESCLKCTAAALQDTSRECPSGLKEQLLGHFRLQLKESESAAASAAPLPASRMQLPGERLLPWLCAFVFFSRLWRPNSAEMRLASDIIKVHKRSPVLVFRDRGWCLVDFLMRHFPAGSLSADSSLKAQELKALRQRQASRLDDGSFVQEMAKNRASVQVWLAQVGTGCQAFETGNISRAVKEGPLLLLRGLGLALAVRSALEEYLVLHFQEGVPVPRSSIHGVALGFHLLHALTSGLAAPRWAELTALLQQHAALRIRTDLEDARARLGSRTSDQLNARLLKVAVSSIYAILGGGTPELVDFYFDVGSLALCFAGQADLLSTGPGGYWREFRVLGQWRGRLDHLCDTSWCYWARQLFPEVVVELRSKPRGSAALPWLCHAFAKALGNLPAVESEIGLRYARDLRGVIDSSVISPVCALIEEDLRLHTHAVVQAMPDGLPSSTSSRREVVGALALCPLRLGPSVLVDVKDEIELRLSKTFYDLTALAPQLAATYERMRSLASERYGLDIVDGRLPSGSLDHGLDAIEIMRNVHQFAAQYSYSLHQQLFVQSSNQGEVKVRIIGMDHVATSIQMHGAGVINTMVNYIYGYLRRKLEVVVEFLSDEAVKSRMLTDRRWLAEQRGYTWSRAAETARFIRKLGASKDGVSFLDKLRQVITQIGNSLGYVRLVRAAGMRCVAGGLPYADAARDAARANTEGQGSFSKAAAAASLPPLIGSAAEVADTAHWSTRHCFEASTDYLNILAQFFARMLDGALRPSNGAAQIASPVSLFHLLAPALSESFLHAVLGGREALAKRAMTSATSKRTNAFYVDDGFALGLAWILRVFRLEHDFHAMHWFEAEIPDDGLSAVSTASVGAHFAETTGASRRELLQQELGHLAATFEAASSLFGAHH